MGDVRAPSAAVAAGTPSERLWADENVHHGSHVRLLRTPGPDTLMRDVDAIIVPTARPVEQLRHVMHIATDLSCTLVALCSKRADAASTVTLGRSVGTRVIALDIDPTRPPAGMPRFSTTATLEGMRFARMTDLSHKRNIGLILARLAGWERVVFLDDDIEGVKPGVLRRASGLLDTFPVVGLTNNGFPDNSVLCHAHRAVSGRQDTFIGAGALAFSPARNDRFFPDVYNEDWLFLIDHVGSRSVVIGGTVAQQPYDPFASPRRAQIEEFGDSLGEGLYWLLDWGYGPEDADEAFWMHFLNKRRKFIKETMERVRSSELHPEQRTKMLNSLQTSRYSNAKIVTPRMCVEYLRRWHEDQERWQEHLTCLPVTESLDKALVQLGLAYHSSDSLSAGPTTVPRATTTHSLARGMAEGLAADREPRRPRPSTIGGLVASIWKNVHAPLKWMSRPLPRTRPSALFRVDRDAH